MSQLEHLEAIERRLWSAADTLRANSNYASNEYFLPVMGLVFLRHACSRYLTVKDAIAADLPTRGVVFDPACGSGGMFVQSARTMAEHGQSPIERLTFRGLEKNATTIRLARTNLAVHGLEVEGLVKLVDRAEIAANAWSLTPGRYVGVAPEVEDEGFDFAEALRTIHAELDDLNAEGDAMTEEIRWQYRFRNFARAFTLLREALEGDVEALSQLEREGVIQRFEYTFELAWNLLKDWLEYDGIVLPTVTPRHVIRQAFQARLIQDGDVWIDMLTDRNLMSHTYDFAKFEVVIRKIQRQYLAILGELYERLSLEVLES